MTQIQDQRLRNTRMYQSCMKVTTAYLVKGFAEVNGQRGAAGASSRSMPLTPSGRSLEMLADLLAEGSQRNDQRCMHTEERTSAPGQPMAADDIARLCLRACFRLLAAQ